MQDERRQATCQGLAWKDLWIYSSGSPTSDLDRVCAVGVDTISQTYLRCLKKDGVVVLGQRQGNLEEGHFQGGRDTHLVRGLENVEGLQTVAIHP